MARTILLDTGVVVALTNRRDPDHEACLSIWSELRAKLVTVEGVLVEAAHLLARARGGPRGAVELVLAANAEIRPTEERTLRRAIDLVERYANVPMDLVDALLVATAEERAIDEILTLDRRGFETYRILGKRKFRILPSE